MGILQPRALAARLEQQQVGIRVIRVNPNPNPKCRVPEMSGFDYFQQISGCIFQNPKFQKPE